MTDLKYIIGEEVYFQLLKLWASVKISFPKNLKLQQNCELVIYKLIIP